MQILFIIIVINHNNSLLLKCLYQITYGFRWFVDKITRYFSQMKDKFTAAV